MKETKPEGFIMWNDMQYMQCIIYNTLIYRKWVFIRAGRVYSGALKKGFWNFQSLLCFVLITDHAISATIFFREHHGWGFWFWFLLFFFQIIAEMVLPCRTNTGPHLKISKFSTWALDLTGPSRLIILPLFMYVEKSRWYEWPNSLKAFVIYWWVLLHRSIQYWNIFLLYLSFQN